jgi:hypothetical protein
MRLHTRRAGVLDVDVRLLGQEFDEGGDDAAGHVVPGGRVRDLHYPPIVEEARGTALLALRQQPLVSLPARVGQEDTVLLTILQHPGHADSSTSVNPAPSLIHEFKAVTAR